MDHVSTLCALSTVGIAPTGLALGRAERSQKPSLFRRKTLSQDQPLLPQYNAKTSIDARPKTALPPRTSVAAEWQAEKEQRLADSAYGNQYQPGLRGASLSFSAVRRRRRGQTFTAPPLQIPENESTDSQPDHARRPSTSWLRRLSMVSFQTESPTASSPVTPSFNGSASPIFPRPPSQRRPPNKLIKRPASQHTNTHPLGSQTISGPSPSVLRRPATSHQRSESMRLPLATDFDDYFPKNLPVESPGIEDYELDKKTEWTSFFLPRAGKLAERLSRRFSTSTAPKVQSVRQIGSDQSALPVLILASDVATTTTTMPGEDQPFPGTPVEFRNPFQAAAPGPAPDPVLEQVERPSHRHSYSVNDAEQKQTVIANTVTGSGVPILGRPRGGSLKRVKGRTFSIPRSELSKSERIIAISTPDLEQRRNITDPNVFRRPHPVSQPGGALSALERRSQVVPRSVSQDYNIGLGSRSGLDPVTSDAVALSAWQRASRPNGQPYSLRRRPKGFSISGSDPSSTIIGSDDTRVFTSCDDYETDIMSDYWDSVRTRETTGSGLKGLRIETMFDKAGTSLANEEVTTLETLLPRGSFAARSLERDPQLFTDPFLASPPLDQVPMVDNSSVLTDGPDDDALSMIGALPGESDSGFQSPLSLALSKFAEQSESGLTSAKGSRIKVDASNSVVNKKTNIFDWSEQSRPDREASDTETRPRTMHGKQEGVLDRSSRAVCRKAPSTVHLRSQSVPVVSDIPTSDSRQTSGKFGTWGLGSKGVSEDWDSDFDFDECEDTPTAENTQVSEPETIRQSMTVPKAILERQASLRGQFGQVQELTLLVEELKRLRHQASVLDLVSGPSCELWKEAEGIVNLATIDDEEEHRSPPGSPSSLTFSFDESEDEGLHASSKRNSEVSWSDVPQRQRETPSPLTQLAKDSPKSQSVLEILQTGDKPLDITPRAQKLPFDTSSLKDLVVRAGVVTRALKEVIRKAEGVATSPQDVFPQDPPFRRIFDKPSHDDLASFEAALADF
ncbi:hypothetical protein N7508_000762 [Penicillium antarcticum]|uniref:uncharacterized protein n=1 Tax=Penicillium antarcticum TaxID=416450 RepID=UPI00239D07ED|nr:uncharacterized protein N7508_000762 [Penicillium antarcticum]KAJ5320479.1 hypothetical protein N7508_000762 [Penicillium antarcticum]